MSIFVTPRNVELIAATPRQDSRCLAVFAGGGGPASPGTEDIAGRRRSSTRVIRQALEAAALAVAGHGAEAVA
jgi:hypothetical protein